MTKQKQFFFFLISIFKFLFGDGTQTHRKHEQTERQCSLHKVPTLFYSYGTKKYCICDGETFINLNFKSLLMMPSRLI